LKSECSQAAIFDSEWRDIEDMLDMNHVAGCPHCSRLLDGHRKFAQAFQSAPRNSPSIHFNHQLKSRLRDEQLFERKSRVRALVMRLYWFLATIAAMSILWFIPAPSQLSSAPVVASLAVFLVLVAVVPVVIFRTMRMGRTFI